MPFLALGSIWELLKKYVKNEFITILNEISLMAHMESELDMLGIARNLVKYEVR
jgi:hypothetical protein